MSEYILEAHRGVAYECPDNTIAAFRAAKEQGYGMIELDTKFTKDNKCVILHNRTINHTARYSDGRELEKETAIAEITLEEARTFDYGFWKGEQFRGELIPTLEEAIAFSRENSIPLKFDNVIQSHTEEQLNIFFDTFERENAISHVGFTSNNVEFIKKILARFPNAQIHYDGTISEAAIREVSSVVPRDQLTVWLRFHNDRTSWCNTPAASAELCAMTKKYAKIGVWLLDKREELEIAVEWGADIIETDGKLKPIK